MCVIFSWILLSESQTGKAISDAVLNVLETMEFSDEVLQKRLIGLCTDGASNLQGEMNGALALMKSKLNTDFVVFHCMAHKLELAVHDVLKVVTEIKHFQIFVDSLYAHFSRSPKNQHQLKDVAAELHVKLLKVLRVFDIRWVSSSYRSVCSIWQSYAALIQHFQASSIDNTRNARERAKCSGMCNKLKKWQFVGELAIIQDALQVVKSLSLFLQKRTASVLTADAEISNTVKTLKAMKEGEGVCSKEFMEEYTMNSTFHGILITEPSHSVKSNFTVKKSSFFQAMVDNISSRFSSGSSVIKESKVLIKENWPVTEDSRMLFGDSDILHLSRRVKMKTSQASAILRQFRLLKEGHESQENNELKELNRRLMVLPISSAECERGFSSMNLTHTSQ